MSSPAITRLGRALLTGVTAMAVLPVLAGPAAAANPLGPSEGDDPGRGLGAAGTLVLFVAVPLAILLATAALVWLPGMLRARRYRPTRGWSAAPVWFAGPPDPASAVQDAQVGELVRGGASGGW